MEGENNINLWRELRTKLFAVIIAFACFATVFQTAINELRSWMGVTHSTAYRLFVSIYFIVPVVLGIIYLLNDQSFRQTVFSKVDRKSPLLFITLAFIGFGSVSFYRNVNDPWLLYLFLTLAYGIIMVFVLKVDRGFAAALLIPVLIISWFRWVIPAVVSAIFLVFYFYRVSHTSVRPKKYTLQYFIIVALALVLASSVLQQNRLQLFSSRNDLVLSIQQIFLDFENNTRLSEKIDSTFTTVNSQIAKSGSCISLLESIHPALRNQKHTDSLLNGKAPDENLSPIIVKWKRLLTTPIDSINHNQESSDAFFSDLDLTSDSLIAYLNDIIKYFNDAIQATQFQNTSKMYEYRSDAGIYARVANALLSDAIAASEEYDSAFKSRWLIQTNVLQFKGLLWFFTIILILFTIRHWHISGHADPADPRAPSEWRQRKLNTVSRIDSVIYLLLLLAAPYFKNFDAEDINLEKPFININASDLAGNFFNSREKESDLLRVKEKLNTTIKPLIIRYPVTSDDVPLSYYMPITLNAYDTTYIIADTSTSVLRILKELGDRSIDNISYRVKFKKLVDAEIEKHNK